MPGFIGRLYTVGSSINFSSIISTFSGWAITGCAGGWAPFLQLVILYICLLNLICKVLSFSCYTTAYGFCVPAFMLENSLQKERLYSNVYVQKNLIEYHSSKKGRIAAIAACHEKKRSFYVQLVDSVNLLIGFAALFNGATSALLCNFFIPVQKDAPPFPCVYGAVVHFVLMLIVGDFFLYW